MHGSFVTIRAPDDEMALGETAGSARVDDFPSA
jgi:hypothetical protein